MNKADWIRRTEKIAQVCKWIVLVVCLPFLFSLIYSFRHGMVNSPWPLVILGAILFISTLVRGVALFILWENNLKKKDE